MSIVPILYKIPAATPSAAVLHKLNCYQSLRNHKNYYAK